MHLQFHWPQITFLVMSFVGLGISIEQRGKPKTGLYSFWSSLIAIGVELFLLTAGGFFGR